MGVCQGESNFIYLELAEKVSSRNLPGRKTGAKHLSQKACLLKRKRAEAKPEARAAFQHSSDETKNHTREAAPGTGG